MHGWIIESMSLSFLLAHIYRDNDPIDWIPLWDDLQSFAINISAPWMVMGDFNNILYYSKILREILFLILRFIILVILFLIIA